MAPRTKRSSATAVLVLVPLVALGSLAAYPPPLGTTGGMVAADAEAASRAGAEVLAAGGNAVDAAVATALALGVVSPAASGLGGGGFALVYRASDRSARVVDFREVAPGAATASMFLRDGRPDPALSRVGGLGVAVPGEPAGLAWLSKRYGRLGLARCAAPAIRLARQGFVASWHLAAVSARVDLATVQRVLLLSPGAPAPRQGDRLWRRDLGATIDRWARLGPDGFYRGPIARAIVESTRASGGILTEADLAAYRPIEREPLRASYRGHDVLAAPPPAGGVTLLEALGVIERLNLSRTGAGSSATLHVLAEAFRVAFADRARAHGDPAFSSIPVAEMLDRAALARRAAAIRADRAAPLAGFAGVPARGGGTSHLSVVDAEGNAVALTTTVNLDFGAQIVARGTGVILNDEMDDFSAAEGASNAFGLVQGAANGVQPGKRPASSMTPAIVLSPEGARLVLGGSGGPHIVTGVAQVLVNVLDFGMDPAAAVGAPRIHHQLLPDELAAEPEVPADVRDALAARGHRVTTSNRPSAVQLIERRVTRGRAELTGASDPRKGGAPAAAGRR